jgi:hypothetical protein
MTKGDNHSQVDGIAGLIREARGYRIILDSDLAQLYGVTTKRLNEQVRRNLGRFPNDFAFQLTSEEVDDLRSQIATSTGKWGGRRYPPMAFTEHGAVMLASVLNSPVAVETSIRVVRAFVYLRGALAAHAELARKLDAMEARYDTPFRAIFEAIRSLITENAGPQQQIGFRQGMPDEHRAT